MSTENDAIARRYLSETEVFVMNCRVNWKTSNLYQKSAFLGIIFYERRKAGVKKNIRNRFHTFPAVNGKYLKTSKSLYGHVLHQNEL